MTTHLWWIDGECLEKSSQISSEIHWGAPPNPVGVSSEQSPLCFLISWSHTAAPDSRSSQCHLAARLRQRHPPLAPCFCFSISHSMSPAPLPLWSATSSPTGFLAVSHIWQVLSHTGPLDLLSLCWGFFLRPGASCAPLLLLQTHLPQWAPANSFYHSPPPHFIIQNSENFGFLSLNVWLSTINRMAGTVPTYPPSYPWWLALQLVQRES